MNKKVIAAFLLGALALCVLGFNTITPGVGPETAWAKLWKKMDTSAEGRTNLFKDIAASKLVGDVLTLDATTGVVSFQTPSGGSSTINAGAVLYVSTNGNDLTAQIGNPNKPWLDLRAAVLAASVGQLVWVKPGEYNTNNLWKPGVNIYGEPGANLSYTDNSGPGLGLFDDRSGAGTNTIIWHGRLFYLSEDPISLELGGAFVLTNANSILTADINYIDIQIKDGSAGARAGAFCIKNCREANITVHDIYDGGGGNSYASGLYWENGLTHFNFGRMVMDDGYGLWFQEPNGLPATDVYVRGQYMSVNTGVGQPTCVRFTGTNNNYKAWVDVLEIKNLAAAYAVGMDGPGGKLYLKSQKVGSATSAFQVLGGIGWFDIDKISASLGNWLTASGGETYWAVRHWDDHTTNLVSGWFISGGFHNFGPGIAKMGNGKGLHQTSGTNRFTGMLIDTTGTNVTTGVTNNKPVYLRGGQLNLQAMALIAPAGTYSVASSNAQTLFVDNGLSANTSFDAGVTVGGRTNYFGPVEVRSTLKVNGTSEFLSAAEFGDGINVTGGVIAGIGGGILYTGSGNNGNLATSVDTLQELNDAVDNLSLGGGSGGTNFPAILHLGFGTNMAVGTGVEKSFYIATNANLMVGLTGEPRNGEQVGLTVSNTSASTIYVTIYTNGAIAGIYDYPNATVATNWSILPSSMRQFDFFASTNAQPDGQFRWENRSNMRKGYKLEFVGRGLMAVTNETTGVITALLTNSATLLASNATTGYIDGSLSGTPRTRVINLNTALTLYPTNEIDGVDHWTYIRVDDEPRVITISTNLLAGGWSITKTLGSVGAISSGNLTFTATNGVPVRVNSFFDVLNKELIVAIQHILN